MSAPDQSGIMLSVQSVAVENALTAAEVTDFRLAPTGPSTHETLPPVCMIAADASRVVAHLVALRASEVVPQTKPPSLRRGLLCPQWVH
jgi:hypothetical protein